MYDMSILYKNITLFKSLLPINPCRKYTPVGIFKNKSNTAHDRLAYAVCGLYILFVL